MTPEEKKRNKKLEMLRILATRQTDPSLKSRREANVKRNLQNPEGIVHTPDSNPEEEIAELEKVGKMRGMLPDGSIINVFTPQEKEALSLMIKHGEFNKKESAVLRYLIASSAGGKSTGNFEDIAEMIAAETKNGKTPTHQAAKGRFTQILAYLSAKLAKVAKLKPGKTLVDVFDWNLKVENWNKIQKKLRKNQDKQRSREEKQAMRDFWETYRELNRVRKAHGLPRKGFGDLQKDIDEFPNADGTRGLMSQGEKVRLPVQSVNYHGGSDAIERKEGVYNDQ